VDLNFNDLSAEQEQALHKVLGHCRYLAASSKWNLDERVLREVVGMLASDFDALGNVTAKKAAQANAPRIRPDGREDVVNG
jgi:hypothetical protein